MGLKYYCYKNGSTTPFTWGYVGDNPASVSLQYLYSRIPLSNMQAGDNLVVKLSSDEGTFSYSLIYKYLQPYEDNEENCCPENAISLAEGATAEGNVGEYDHNTEQFADQFDTYKIILRHAGSIKVAVTAKNDECNDYSYVLSADVLDMGGNELNSFELMRWEDYPACDQLMSDTVKIRAFSAGTYYLRLRTDRNTDYIGKVSYKISYEMTDSTGNIDPEPNFTTATAIPISPGEVKRGNMNFMNEEGSYDFRDYYKPIFPADGSMKVYFKAIFRNNDPGGSMIFSSNGFYSEVSTGVNDDYFMPDSVYLDTFTICGTGGGDVYFQVQSSSSAFEYEFRYEITDTSSIDNDIEPNDSFAEAKLIGAGALKKGHIRYVNEDTNEDYDFYKMVYATTDSLKIYLTATNTSCFNNREITFRLYNKTFSNLQARTKTGINAGQTITDSIKVRVVAPDTMYLRIEASDAFKYEFTTNLRLPTSLFSITGDTAVCVSTQVYKAVNVADEPVTYNWSLPDGGGTLSFVDSIATVNWTTTGNRRIQLYLSNDKGNSQTKQRTVIINGFPPTQVPIAYNFARALSTNSLPPGTTCQWYKNDTLVPGAVNSFYYAEDAGHFTVRFVNDCGGGPSSNEIVFDAAAIAQTIAFPHAPDVSMSPTAHVKLIATASSDLPVFYQKISGNGFIQNDTLFIVGNSSVGTIVIKAMQPGDDIFRPAADVFDTITVIKGDQVITFDSIPDQVLNTTALTLTARSDMETSITYSIVAGSTLASVNNDNDKLTKKGAGTVTVRATHNGNANYNPATPAERTFCIGLRTLTPITGDANPCLNTYRYNTQKIPGADYVWALSGGGILTTHNDTAWVQWQAPGAYTLTVKANSPCDAVYTETKELAIVTSNNSPTAVSNMLPADNSPDEQLPLTLSWIPGTNTVNYDLYVWDSAAVQPGIPYATNINASSYTLSKNSLAHNATYKWRVVAKNPCTTTAGPVQHFRVIPLPDLVVSNVQAPATATSGQTVTISWTVTNVGPGKNTAQLYLVRRRVFFIGYNAGF